MLRFLLLAIFILGSPALCAGSLFRDKPETNCYDLREGDIVFQGNAGPQSDAVRAATASPYTHCGIVFEKDGKLMVMEALQPVQITSLKRFVERSLPATFHAKRLNKPLDPVVVAKARAWAINQAGLNYDLRFVWSNEELYCSEFVWKLFHHGGIELCKPRPFRSYQLDAPAVKTIINQRFGGIQNLPLDEPAVSPGDLAASPLLHEVPKLSKKR